MAHRPKRAGKPPAIHIVCQDARWKRALRPYAKTVQSACAAALAFENQAGGELTVLLADDDCLKALNHQFCGKNKPTNVLSFPGEGDYLGDMALAYDTLEREAAAQGKTLRRHALHLLVHGTMHLLGYDHESQPEAARMEKREINILAGLGIPNPYL